MNYTNEMKYKHILRRIKEGLENPTSINNEACDLDDIINNIVWLIEDSGTSFDKMVEDSMEIERLTS